MMRDYDTFTALLRESGFEMNEEGRLTASNEAWDRFLAVGASESGLPTGLLTYITVH
jgi:ASC-1-like (ASCH) protein